MPDYSNIKHMFTYASSDLRYGRGTSPALIFACLDPHDEKFSSIETPMTLSRHPLVREVMGDVYFVKYFDGNEGELWHHNREVRRWVFTLEMKDVLQSMDDGNYDAVLIKMEGKQLGAVTPKGIVDSCYLPHKYTKMCLECATSTVSEKHLQSPHNCFLKNSMRRYASGHILSTCIPSSVDLGDLREDMELVNRETTIDQFTYISPALTEGGVPDMVRPAHNHDFTNVQEVSDQRAEAQHERRRYVRFQAEVCTTCCVQKSCERYEHEHTRRWCSGPYPTDRVEVIDSILDQAMIPFSNPQLRYLLANSGIFPRRYNRRIIAGTFEIMDNTLVFAIRHKTSPWPHNDAAVFENIRDARKFIKKYGHDHAPRHVPDMTRECRAILCEAASHYSSPRNNYHWRSVSYPLLYIAPWGAGIKLQYSYHGKGLAGFGMTLDRLEQVYDNFQMFRFCDHLNHDLSRRGR